MITAQTLERIRHFDPGGLPVVSLYVPVPADPGERAGVGTRLASLLDRVRPLTEDPTLSREARLSLREDLGRIETLAGEERWSPQGHALFACSGAGMLEELRLPRRIRDQIVVDATPWVRPLTEVLDEYHRAIVAIVDERSAELWELFQAEMQRLSELEDPALRKPDYAGWYGLEEHRTNNRSKQLARKHFVRVAQRIGELFRSGHYEALVIGGHDDEVAQFRHFLPDRLGQRVVGTFSIDRNTATDHDIRLLASAVLDRFERDAQIRKVEAVLERAAAGQPAAVGLPECLWAATAASIQELLIQDDVRRPGVVCPACGWLGESGETCPVCGSRTRRAPDIVDVLVEHVLDDGGSIVHVEAETELNQHLVAASLRFTPPPRPQISGANHV